MRRAIAPPHSRLLAAACLLVVVAGGIFGWLATSRSAAPEPAQVAAVVAMMTPGSAPTTALRSGEHLVIGGQRLVVRAYQLGGTEELVATSARPFPVPPTSHLLTGSSSQAIPRIDAFWWRRRRPFGMMLLHAAHDAARETR